jgi:general transcription factor IIIA
VHAGQDRYRCKEYPGCSRSFRKRATLERHIRADHLGLPKFPCGNDGCAEGFDSAGALRNHVAKMHAEIAFWCDDCEERDEETGEIIRKLGFTQLALLQSHVRRDHVSCVFCPDVKITNGQWGLTHHMDLYHSGKTVEDRKTVHCTWDGCKAKFTRVSNLNTHIKTAHEGFSWICGQVDLSTEQGLAYWNWEEEGCRDGFVSKVKLVDHVKHVHLGMKRPPPRFTAPPKPAVVDELAGLGPNPYKAYCTRPACDAKFIRHHELKLHLLQDHSDEMEADNGDDGNADFEPLRDQSQGIEDQGSESFWGADAGMLPVDPELERGLEDFTHTSMWGDMQKLVEFNGLENVAYRDS